MLKGRQNHLDNVTYVMVTVRLWKWLPCPLICLFSLPFSAQTFSSCFCHYIISLQLSSVSLVKWSRFVTWLRLDPDPAAVKQWKLFWLTRDRPWTRCATSRAQRRVNAALHEWPNASIIRGGKCCSWSCHLGQKRRKWRHCEILI